jgi:hypothetical protein
MRNYLIAQIFFQKFKMSVVILPRRGCLFTMTANGLRLCDSSGFVPQKFNRSTRLKPITKLSYEALSSPLRQNAVIVAQLGKYN